MLIRSTHTGASTSNLERGSGKPAIITALCAFCFTGSARAGLTHGLSRMMGNHPVRFLGEGAAAMPLPYPTATPALIP
jgi:hypothetical protein